MTRRLQNRIAESRYALPVMAVIAAAVWYAAGVVTQQLWMPALFAAVCTYLMVELNNVNSLIRIYSRMVSCAFLAMTCVCNFLFPSLKAWIVALCFIMFFVLIFHSYQDKKASGYTCYAFLCIGISSIVFVQVLFYVPLFWILMATFLNSLSHRTFWASVIGLLIPYWLAIPYLAFTDQLSIAITHFSQIASFEAVPVIQAFEEHRLFSFAFLLLVSQIGIIHYWRNSVMDKIRVRQLYEVLIVTNLATTIFLVLQPQHADALIPIMIVSASAPIAHFLSLTHTKLTNIIFILFAVLCVCLTIYNLWMPSLIF